MERNYVLHVYKTIDEFIPAMERNKYRDMDVYTYVVTYFSQTLLSILESETNVPSVHDISIISSIGDIRTRVLEVSIPSTIGGARSRILEIYKNRK